MTDWDQRYTERSEDDAKRRGLRLPTTGSHRVDWLIMLGIVLVLLVITI